MWECSHVQQLNQGQKGTRRFFSLSAPGLPVLDIHSSPQRLRFVSPVRQNTRLRTLCNRLHKIRNCAKRPVDWTKSGCKMSTRVDKIGGAWFLPREERHGSGVQSLATVSGAATYYTRADVMFCQVFCKRRNVLLHQRAPIAPDQDEKAAFSGAAVSCSLQIRLDSPRGSIQVPAYSLNLCPVRSAGVPDGRRMGGRAAPLLRV